METQPDFRELLAFHGAPRFTGDLDIFVKPDAVNAQRILTALAAFGFASVGLTPSDFERPDQVVQLGVPPVRIDLITSITWCLMGSGMAIPGFGRGTLAASLARGVFRGHEAQKFHALSGGIEARQVPDFGHGGYGHRALDAAQGLEGFDHWMEAPGFDLLLEFLVKTLEAFRVFVHGTDIFLKDDVLCRGWANHFREPPEMGRVPGGPARVPDVVPEQEGFETEFGVCEIAEGIVACPA